MANVIKASARVTKNTFGKIARALPGKVSAAVGASVLDLESEIKQHIVAVGAVDTGLMLNSTQGNHESDAMDGDVTNATEYWPVINYGGASRAARPFVEPAADVVRPRHAKRVKDALL